MPTIRELYHATDRVIGQEKARQALAVLLRRQALVSEGIYAEAGGVLVAGPTGVGKTMATKLMCQQIGVPFADTDATRYTDAGYVGLDLSRMFLPLIMGELQQMHAEPDPDGPLGMQADAVKEAVSKAERGVVLLDEMDKWLSDRTLQGMASDNNRQVGKKLQSELLKMLEGDVLFVSSRDDEVGVLFSTERVMIICCGAFVGLDEVVERRTGIDPGSVNLESLWETIIPEDFVTMGMIPELAGRLATHVIFTPLKELHLTQILAVPGGMMQEYHERFRAEGCELRIEQTGVLALASEAIKRGMGARALRNVVEKICGPALFRAADEDAPTRAILDGKAVRDKWLAIESKGSR